LLIEGIGKLDLPLVAESVNTDRLLTLGVRPEHAELDGAYGKVTVPGIVNIVENLGGETYVHVEVAPNMPLVTAKLHGSRGPGRGGRVKLYFPPDKIHLFEADGSAVPAIYRAESGQKQR
jgi:multiple sugar transport system ATP-binding protein